MKRILLIPPRINVLLTKNHSRGLRIILMILVLITALYTKEYKGEYQAVINTNIGGIFYVLFGSLLFSLIFPRLKYYWSVSLALGLTCLLEFIQYFRIPFMIEMAHYKAFAYLFGVSFNPVDFIYYAGGTLISFLVLFILDYEEKKTHPMRPAENALPHTHEEMPVEEMADSV